jgi:hypothetical protein
MTRRHSLTWLKNELQKIAEAMRAYNGRLPLTATQRLVSKL